MKGLSTLCVDAIESCEGSEISRKSAKAGRCMRCCCASPSCSLLLSPLPRSLRLLRPSPACPFALPIALWPGSELRSDGGEARRREAVTTGSCSRTSGRASARNERTGRRGTEGTGSVDAAIAGCHVAHRCCAGSRVQTSPSQPNHPLLTMSAPASRQFFVGGNWKCVRTHATSGEDAAGAQISAARQRDVDAATAFLLSLAPLALSVLALSFVFPERHEGVRH